VATEARAEPAEAEAAEPAAGPEAPVHPGPVGPEVFSSRSHQRDLQSVVDALTIYRQRIA
jgi:hypothetical protein